VQIYNYFKQKTNIIKNTLSLQNVSQKMSVAYIPSAAKLTNGFYAPNINKVFVVDIETNGLLADMLDFSSFPYKLKESAMLWCAVIRCVGTDEVWSCVGDECTVAFFRQTLLPAEVVVAHNGIKFDFVVLKLFGVFDYTIGHYGQSDTLFGRDVLFLDTLIMSRLFNPDRYGGHSLDSWGERTGCPKMNYREELIKLGDLEPDAPKGYEFSFYHPLLLTYCGQDTKTNALTFIDLLEEEYLQYDWSEPLRQEHKLADYAIRRESLGFFFDKEKALWCLDDLAQKMKNLSEEVNPFIPDKKLNQGELKDFTPPKNQINKNGSISAHMQKFAQRVGGEILYDEDNNISLKYKGEEYALPFTEPLETKTEATIDDLDVVKHHLIDIGWNPLEWKERDITKDIKKQNLSYEKRVAVLNRWIKETSAGKYKKHRLAYIQSEYHANLDTLPYILESKLEQDWPIRLITSPSIRVGVVKEICPRIAALKDEAKIGEKVALYYTYRHRKSSIAGGDIEDIDFDEEAPNTGFLSKYREIDKRIPTPAIEIGAATSRYKHISVANISRVTSIYGEEMRSLFGCGYGAIQLGYDFASLEARVMAHFIEKYPRGVEVGLTLNAVKPNDVHTINAQKMGVPRTDAKSVFYGLLYGASAGKISKMLGISKERGKEVYDDFWEAMLPLKMLKDNLLLHWEKNDKKFIRGIDGRKIRARSPHSLLNALFQSAGVICAKYVSIFLMEEVEKFGLVTDVFVGEPDVCSMIEYHDEGQLFLKRCLGEFKTFETKQQAADFVSLWEHEQLSAVAHGKKYYVALPNPVSRAITMATKRTEELLSLRFELGFEWVVGKNWAQCH